MAVYAAHPDSTRGHPSAHNNGRGRSRGYKSGAAYVWEEWMMQNNWRSVIVITPWLLKEIGLWIQDLDPWHNPKEILKKDLLVTTIPTNFIGLCRCRSVPRMARLKFLTFQDSVWCCLWQGNGTSGHNTFCCWKSPVAERESITIVIFLHSARIAWEKPCWANPKVYLLHHQMLPGSPISRHKDSRSPCCSLSNKLVLRSTVSSSWWVQKCIMATSHPTASHPWILKLSKGHQKLSPHFVAAHSSYWTE